MREFPDLPLRDVVFKTLRRGIHQGLLVPGERLIEEQLAERLGVSRTPIREAIRMLELEGLVAVLPRRGAVVSNITSKELNDVLEVRLFLEKFAAGLACGRITPEAVEDLERAEKLFAEAVEQGDYNKMAARDADFHGLLYKAADNNVLLKLIDNMQEQMYRYRLEYLKDKDIHQKLIGEHGDIVNSLKNRDREKAEETAVRHIEEQRRYILELIGDE
jgi:DNA-binding GntR family transcriptional regulator